MRAAGDQAKMACGNLQLFSGLEAGIKGTTHAMGQRGLDRVQERQEDVEETKVAEEDKEESGGIAAGILNLNTEMQATEEEATEGLASALAMKVKEDRGSEG